MEEPKYILEEGNGGNSEREDARLVWLMVGNGSVASPHNHGTHVVGLEGYTGTGTSGRLGPLVLAVALGAVCHLNAVCTV